MATVDPRYFDIGGRFQEGMQQGRQQRLQDIALGQQQEDRQRTIAGEQRQQATQQQENQYKQHVAEAGAISRAARALKRVPKGARMQALDQWAQSSPIIAGVKKKLPPDVNLDDDDGLEDFAMAMDAAAGGFQGGSAVQSVEMDESGNLFIINRDGSIAAAMDPTTKKQIVGRKPQAQVGGKRIIQGVDPKTGQPTFQIVDLATEQAPTIRPQPTKQPETTFDKEIAKQTAKRIAEVQDTLPVVSERLQSMKAVLSGFEGGKYSTGMENVLIPDYLQSTNNQELITKINQEVLGKAEQMKGALSDKDVAFLKSATLDLNKGEAANKRILADVIAVLERAASRAGQELSHYESGGSIKDFHSQSAAPTQQPSGQPRRLKYNPATGALE